MSTPRLPNPFVTGQIVPFRPVVTSVPSRFVLDTDVFLSTLHNIADRTASRIVDQENERWPLPRSDRWFVHDELPPEDEIETILARLRQVMAQS